MARSDQWEGRDACENNALWLNGIPRKSAGLPLDFLIENVRPPPLFRLAIATPFLRQGVPPVDVQSHAAAAPISSSVAAVL